MNELLLITFKNKSNRPSSGIVLNIVITKRRATKVKFGIGGLI